eukprot:GHVR01118082.1.p1 GENE.GHVR01118082.1~~GHVR01118082.1.p1  ORF type:complete len:149 (+),score=13.38 GHVR01118082.1:69-449(+)
MYIYVGYMSFAATALLVAIPAAIFMSIFALLVISKLVDPLLKKLNTPSKSRWRLKVNNFCLFQLNVTYTCVTYICVWNGNILSFLYYTCLFPFRVTHLLILSLLFKCAGYSNLMVGEQSYDIRQEY